MEEPNLILGIPTRMPFGLRNMTAHFQRVMDHKICKAGLHRNCTSFADDILIDSKTADEHLKHFKQVLEMLEGCGLKAHPDQTVICTNVVEYLGHNVSKSACFLAKQKLQQCAISNHLLMCLSCVACLDL